MADVLEREVFHAGTTLLTAEEKETNAYIIQSGKVGAFMVRGGQKIKVDEHGMGQIIGETNLLIDMPNTLTYEAIEDTTVIKLVRQDFEKKLKKVDKTLMKVIEALLKKLQNYEQDSIYEALQGSNIEDEALEIVNHLLRNMSFDRKKKYEEVLLPNFNSMIKSLEQVKRENRHKKQKEALDKKLAEINDDIKG